MSRRGMYKSRVIVPDPVYNDIKVAKFINILMFDGKKAVAEKILYKSMETAKDKLGIEPLEIFYKAIENTRPFAEVRSRRVGGATYQVPIDVKDERSWVLGMRFIILAARKKAGSGMAESLAAEFMDAYDNKGSAVKVKEEKHKVAEANRAFAQFRW